MSINTEDYEWLGIVYPNDVQIEGALITPLAYHDENAWYPIYSAEGCKYFPSNGKAVVPAKVFHSAALGRLCYFQAIANPLSTNPEKAGYSHFVVGGELTMEKPLVQILDWSTKANEPLDLPQLLTLEVKVTNCFSQTIYIRYQNELYGPIQLERIADQLWPSEYVKSTNTGGKALFVSVYKLPEEGILELGDIPHELDFFDEYILDTPLRQEDWSLPQVVIKRMLIASNEVLSDRENDLHIVERHLRELAWLSSSDGPPALHIELATLNRAQYIVKQQMERLHNIHSFIADLPAAHPLMKAAREQEIQLRSREIAQQAEARIQTQTTLLEKVQREVLAVEERVRTEQTRLIALQASIPEAEQRKAQVQQELELFEHEVRQHLLRLREEPLQVLAELQMTVSLFALLGQNGSCATDLLSLQPAETPTNHSPTVQHKPAVDGVNIWLTEKSTGAISADLGTMSSKDWVQLAQQVGVKSLKLREYIAALLAGLIPNVSCQEAIPIILAAAQVIASARVWVVPVPLTALTPLDLFGMIDAERQMFIPSAGGLADIILQARQHPQELALVVLEGIDRVPGHAVYGPLLRQYIEQRPGASHTLRSAPLSLFHPRALTQNDPYRELAWFSWPNNLLLAVTLDSEIQSLPPPSQYHALFVQLEAADMKNTFEPRSQFPDIVSHVPLKVWHRWQQEVQADIAQATNDEERSWHQRVFYHSLTVLGFKNPQHVWERIWPQLSEDDTSNRSQGS